MNHACLCNSVQDDGLHFKKAQMEICVWMRGIISINRSINISINKRRAGMKHKTRIFPYAYFKEKVNSETFAVC